MNLHNLENVAKATIWSSGTCISGEGVRLPRPGTYLRSHLSVACRCNCKPRCSEILHQTGCGNSATECVSSCRSQFRKLTIPVPLGSKCSEANGRVEHLFCLCVGPSSVFQVGSAPAKTYIFYYRHVWVLRHGHQIQVCTA